MDEGVNVDRVRVWDSVVRVVHWLVVALVIAAWLTRDARDLDLHAAAGYSVLILAAFRIAWGFIGTTHARFRDFAYSPRAALAYFSGLVQGKAVHYRGHNPAGSWSVYALLAFEIAVTVTGIVAVAGMHDLGPLAGIVDHLRADLALQWHEWIAWAMLALVAVHIAGVVTSSLVHRENLVAAMVSGRKPAALGPAISVPAHLPLALGLVAALGTLAWIYLARAAEAAASHPVSSSPATASASWKRECESCHLAYAPCMLPAASWLAMLDGQSDHFGEDLALSGEIVDELRLASRAPAPGEPWACYKTRASVRAGGAPQQITATPYWKTAHSRLEAAAFKTPRVFGTHDCGACHRDAASSIFHPRMIQIPQ